MRDLCGTFFGSIHFLTRACFLSRRRAWEGSWFSSLLAQTSVTKRDWFRLATSRSGQWQAVGRKFFPRKRPSKDQVGRLRAWKLGQPLPLPPPKRVRRTDVRPRPPRDDLTCEVCGLACPSYVALRSHYRKHHAVLDDQLVTTRSFHCLRCSSTFFFTLVS